MPEEEVITPEAVETPQLEPEAVPEAATTEDDQEPKPKGGFQRKIDKLTRERYELREQLAELRGRLAVQPAAATAQTDEPKPDIAKWTGTYEEFIAAAARWEARQEYKTLSAKEREAAQKAEADERDRETVTSYRERLQEFVVDHEDFSEVIQRIRLPEAIAGPVQVAIVEDEHGPELAYYLGTHPEFQQQISQLTAAGAVKALGRLSERLFPESNGDDEEEEEIPVVESSKPQPRQRPKPIMPTTKSTPTQSGLNDSLSTEEWAKRFRKKMGYGD